MEPADRPLVAFVHVPKTGGTTLHKILLRRMRGIFAESTEEARSRISALNESERARLDLVAGHIPYGVHEIVRRPTTYVTMLREPVRRVASHYWFVRSDPKHYLYRAVVDGDLTCATTPSRLPPLCRDRERPGLDVLRSCTQAEMRRPRVARRSEDGPPRGVHRRRASTRRFWSCSESAGWRRPCTRVRNVGPGRRGPIDLETRRVIDARNALDVELHACANDLLEAHVRRLGPPFQRDLRRFRRVNSGYQVLHRLAQPAARVVFVH